MSKRIERLQGEGARLVWPGSKIDPVAADILALKEKIDAALLGKRSVGQLDVELRKLRGDCAAAFASANGWSVAKTPINPDRFFGPGHVVRHPESFRWAGRSSPAALVIHTHHDYVVELLGKLPTDLTIDSLPSSWYWSGHTTAFCFRRPEGF